VHERAGSRKVSADQRIGSGGGGGGGGGGAPSLLQFLPRTPIIARDGKARGKLPPGNVEGLAYHSSGLPRGG